MRAYTGRDKLLKFSGCYHGHADSFLVQAGSGVATLGLPDSPGVLKSATGSLINAMRMYMAQDHMNEAAAEQAAI